MSKVPTPGTAEWLRYVATGMEDIPKSDLMREGLTRAANRIERLQAELAKQKTGVDPTHCPAPAPRRPAPLFPRPVERPQVPIYRVRMPASEFPTDHREYDRLFDWINGSENLGLGLLDPCEVFVLGEPDVEGGTWDLDTVIGVSTLRKESHARGFVRISGTSRKGLLSKRLGSIDMEGCMVLDVKASGDETIIEFVATSAKEVHDA
jgi:hypothetical protein